MNRDAVLLLINLHRPLAAGHADVRACLDGCEHSLQRITAGDTQSLVRRVANALAVWSRKARLRELARVDIEDLEIVNRLAVVSLFHDGQSTQVVQHSQGIGREVDGAADDRRLWSDLEDFDLGDLVLGSELGEGEGGGEAGDTASKDDHLEAV